MGYNWFLLYFAWLLNEGYCIIMHLLQNLLPFTLHNLARYKHQVINISHSDLQIVDLKMNSSQCSLIFQNNEKKYVTLHCFSFREMSSPLLHVFRIIVPSYFLFLLLCSFQTQKQGRIYSNVQTPGLLFKNITAEPDVCYPAEASFISIILLTFFSLSFILFWREFYETSLK